MVAAISLISLSSFQRGTSRQRFTYNNREPGFIISSPVQAPQVELVLLIFRRLAEDIHLFESGMTSGRRREMTAALNLQSQTVFTYLITCLEVCARVDYSLYQRRYNMHGAIKFLLSQQLIFAALA